jgi:hypothetical protein
MAAPGKISAFVERYGAWIIFFLAVVISIGATTYFFTHGDELLGYKDSLSRLNIARGVTDSRTPGLLQLGTIWLPLYQFLLILPSMNDFLWRTGLAGSIVSGISYVIASVFMLNPNILYMQSIAMTEVLMCATLAGAFYHVLKFIKHNNLLDLIYSAAWVAAASLDRYEGWLAVVACTLLIAFEFLVVRRDWKRAEGYAILYATLAFLGIALWLTWNLVFWGSLTLAIGDNTTYNFAATSSVHGLAALAHYAGVAFGAMKQNIGVGLLTLIPSSLLVVFSKNRKLSLYAISLALVPMLFILISLPRGLPLIAGSDALHAYDLRYGISAILLTAIAAPIVISGIPKFVRYAKPAIAVAAISLSMLALPYAYNTGTEKWKNTGEGLDVSDITFAGKFSSMYQGGNILMANGGVTLNPVKHLANIDIKNYVWEGNGNIWKRALANPNSESIRYVVMADNQGNQVYNAYLGHEELYDKNYKTALTYGPYIILERKNVSVAAND